MKYTFTRPQNSTVMEENTDNIKRNSRFSSQNFMIQTFQDHDFIRITQVTKGGVMEIQELSYDHYYELYKLMTAHFTNVIDSMHLENVERSIAALTALKQAMQTQFKTDRP